MDRMLDTPTAAASPRSTSDYGGWLGYGIFRLVIRFLGGTPAYVLLAFIVPYYVFVRGSARRSAAPYLKHRFPADGALRRTLRSVLHFYRFGQVLIDQASLGILGPGRCRVEFHESEAMRQWARDGHGVVLLTSHFGCWLSAMATMNDLKVPVNFQFRREESKRGRLFFEFNGQESRIRFVDADEFLGGTIELTQALARGEIVSVMGDRAGEGRAGRASFLGEPAAFPLLAYQLARGTDARVVVLLACRTGRLAFRIEAECISDGLDLASMDRGRAAQALLDRYVARLERAALDAPYQWFNFFDIWQTNPPERERPRSPVLTSTRRSASVPARPS